ncbi:MAG: HAMP domain-containing sensor histidine kinase, partial [Bacteroidota bacterium]
LILVVLGCFWWLTRIIFQQKQLSELKNDFINNMTHEFKTPIATIAFATANIENEKRIHEPEQIRQFTRIIKEENSRMNHQVEQVLRAAVVGRNAFRLKQEPVNLHELINQIADAMEVNIQAAGGVLHRRLNAASAALTGDAFHLANVFSNLLDNARKYTDGPPDVTITSENDPRGIWVKVSDKGVGMTADAARKVFDQFYRIPTGNVHTVKGFGLGLSYAKAIVQQHGGDISVESKPGQGSIFAVFLPFEHQVDDIS